MQVEGGGEVRHTARLSWLVPPGLTAALHTSFTIDCGGREAGSVED